MSKQENRSKTGNSICNCSMNSFMFTIHNDMYLFKRLIKMKYIFGAFFLTSLASIALANSESDCTAAQGSYLTGVVVKAPYFTHGQFKKGIELSHTHLSIKADKDQQIYDVAIDNVFATGYKKNSKAVPAPINTIQMNDRLELCGQLYSEGGGIHWVHTNCGDQPSPQTPDGWVKKFDSNGQVSQNFEGGQAFCKLWPKR